MSYTLSRLSLIGFSASPVLGPALSSRALIETPPLRCMGASQLAGSACEELAPALGYGQKESVACQRAGTAALERPSPRSEAPPHLWGASDAVLPLVAH